MNGLDWAAWLIILGVFTVANWRIDERKYVSGYLAALRNVEEEYGRQQRLCAAPSAREIARQLREELDS